MLLALSALPMGAVHATSTNATLNGFQGVNPEFSSEKDVYGSPDKPGGIKHIAL